MSELTRSQARTRDHIERLIALMAPALDVVLAVGDRVSRLAAPEDHEYYPERPLEQHEPAPGPSEK